MGYNQTVLHSLRLFTDPSALSLKKVNIFTSEAFLSPTVSVSWWAPSGCWKSLFLSLIDWPKIISSVDLQCIIFFHLTAPNIVKALFCHRIVMCFCEIYCSIIQHNVKDIFRNCIKQQKTDVLVNWFSPNWCGWLVAENPTWRKMLAESGILFCLSSAIFSQHS